MFSRLISCSIVAIIHDAVLDAGSGTLFRRRRWRAL
jgi:hypothetical protein